MATMSNITIDELRKLARLSNIAINDADLPSLRADIDSVLTYAARVSEIANSIKQVDEPIEIPGYTQLTNVTRPDQPAPCNPEPLLAQAPERIQNFFVVPAIIENK